MKPADGKTIPIWSEHLHRPIYAPPLPDLTTDVCVVGAGIAGLTSAYLLAKAGRSVIVVDAGEVGSGQTERTSAHLASIMDDRFYQIERLLGADAAKLAHASHAAAIDRIEAIVKHESIDCDFARVDAYLMFESAEARKKEFDASKRAGVNDLEEVAKVPVTNATVAIRYGNQAVFHPMRYLVGLAKRLDQLGVQIFTGKRVTDVKGADTKKGTPCILTFEDQSTMKAHHVIVATNAPAPINDWAGIYLKQASYRTYVIGIALNAGSTPNALWWDTQDPYHYVRVMHDPDNDRDVLLVGGEDHKVGQAGASQERFERLATWTRERFNIEGEIVSRWSGQVQEPADGIAFIGKAPTSGKNVFVITGDSGMGLTHGTLGAMLINDLIAKRDNPWAKLYDPLRKETNLEFIKENANTTAQFKDYVTAGEVKNESEVKPGSGALMREGLKKVAVYRDDSGAVHKCSAVCTHLGCIVHWNDVEKSWDCPCHGSRFSAKGEPVMGPAVDGLSSLD